MLVFSYLGYKTQEIKVNGRSSLDVKLLTDVQSMKDFVVNGYQKLKKESYTGSAIVITGEEIKRFNPQNILASIQAYDPSFRIVENNLVGSNPNQLPQYQRKRGHGRSRGRPQTAHPQLARHHHQPPDVHAGWLPGGYPNHLRPGREPY